jgi:hypothetical protein
MQTKNIICALTALAVLAPVARSSDWGSFFDSNEYWSFDGPPVTLHGPGSGFDYTTVQVYDSWQQVFNSYTQDLSGSSSWSATHHNDASVTSSPLTQYMHATIADPHTLPTFAFAETKCTLTVKVDDPDKDGKWDVDIAKRVTTKGTVICPTTWANLGLELTTSGSQVREWAIREGALNDGFYGMTSPGLGSYQLFAENAEMGRLSMTISPQGKVMDIGFVDELGNGKKFLVNGNPQSGEFTVQFSAKYGPDIRGQVFSFNVSGSNKEGGHVLLTININWEKKAPKKP